MTDTGHAAASRLIDLQVGGTSQISVDASGNVSSLGGYDINGDVFLERDAANTLSQRNGTTAQACYTYNSYTDASNYERGAFDWITNSNVLTVGTQKAGTGGTRDLAVYSDGGSTYVAKNAANLWFQTNDGHSSTGAYAVLYGSALRMGSALGVAWTASDATASADASISRVGASTLAIGNGGTGDISGFFQWGGAKYVSTDFSKTSSTALSNVTGLSVTLAANRKYAFNVALMCTCAAAGGVQAAISGTASVSAIQYTGWTVADNAIKGKANASGTSIGTAVGSTTTTETSGIVIQIVGCIIVGGTGGTLTVQFAQNTSNGTASVVKVGSYMQVFDTGP